METKPLAAPVVAPIEQPSPVLTRIYITPDGDVVVTDLWEELEKQMCAEKGFSKS